MALFFICVIINIFVLAYFVAKKWKAVAFVYFVALTVLLSIMWFFIDAPEIVAFLKTLFGERVYAEIMFALEVYSLGALAPYLGIELLTLIIGVIAAIKTIEKTVLCITKRFKNIEVTSKRPANAYSADTLVVGNYNRKLYLNNCLMLC